MEHHHHTQLTCRPAPINSLLALKATLPCVSGCAIGEVLGSIFGTALVCNNLGTVALAVVLAFVSGYAFTLIPLLRAGMGWRMAPGIALAADTASIGSMEVIDNMAMMLILGAIRRDVGGISVESLGDRSRPGIRSGPWRLSLSRQPYEFWRSISGISSTMIRHCEAIGPVLA